MTRPEQSRQTALTAFDGLNGLATRLNALDQSFAEIGQSSEAPLAKQARDQRARIRAFEASVTMIGQVKAGKTTLVNAMIGWPDLLPADVNPWTSVVTSLHLSPHLQAHDRRAAFRFFTDDEWNHLIRQGGRVGEMAARAGAADEMEKVRAQLDEMREKSRARLGRKFHMLLGQTHEYERFDEELIKRYVCLGDDFWEEAGGTREQGRFADITRSADLWLPTPDLPLGLCIRDTPGVNDTFMIREQITINALRGSRLCVVVLSAAQALSSVDLGLIRLISNVRAREVIIFVNRIDELPDPARAVPEIRKSILATLERFDGPKDAEILFGSGYWASHAASGSFDALGEDSAQALIGWAEAQLNGDLAQLSPQEIIWHLSGVPALGQAIAARVEESTGAKLEESLQVALGNLQTGAQAHDSLRGPDAAEVQSINMSAQEILQSFEQIEDRASAALESRLAKAHEVFAGRSDNAQRAFLGRATKSLVKHLEQFGEGEVWTYDPSGLRMLLRSAYKVFVQGAGKAGTDVFQTAASDIDALYRHAFGLSPEVRSIAPPPLPTAPAPVNLGQTIALDLRGGWWSRFWRRQRGYEAFSQDFARLIHEETKPVVDTLHHQSAAPYSRAMRTALAEFIQGQRDIVLGLAGQATAPPPVSKLQPQDNLRHAL
ncbi:dynamin family protein [Antarctobacter jejuensis]|uniref:dynamin family protein n=1 Tax=Antarctobacter jejuensis TaxID=1439938 RepID=UPI003FD2AA88